MFVIYLAASSCLFLRCAQQQVEVAPAIRFFNNEFSHANAHSGQHSSDDPQSLAAQADYCLNLLSWTYRVCRVIMLIKQAS